MFPVPEIFYMNSCGVKTGHISATLQIQNQPCFTIIGVEKAKSSPWSAALWALSRLSSRSCLRCSSVAHQAVLIIDLCHEMTGFFPNINDTYLDCLFVGSKSKIMLRFLSVCTLKENANWRALIFSLVSVTRERERTDWWLRLLNMAGCHSEFYLAVFSHLQTNQLNGSCLSCLPGSFLCTANDFTYQSGFTY